MLNRADQANTSVIHMPCYIACNTTTRVCNGTKNDCFTNATMLIKHELGTCSMNVFFFFDLADQARAPHVILILFFPRVFV